MYDKYGQFIDGKWQKSASGETYDVINPATEEIITSVAECNEKDIDVAVKAARASYEKGHWSKMPPAERKVILLKLAELKKVVLSTILL